MNELPVETQEVEEGGRLRKPLTELFWPNVHFTEGCWLWTAATTNYGYGHIRLKGTEDVSAHRVSWMLAYGSIPEGMHVLHRCDVPACVRPTHLFLGTHADNMADMTAKGRQNKAKMIACKYGHPLTPENVVIFTRHKTGQTYRQCLICKKEQYERSRARAKEVANAGD